MQRRLSGVTLRPMKSPTAISIALLTLTSVPAWGFDLNAAPVMVTLQPETAPAAPAEPATPAAPAANGQGEAVAGDPAQLDLAPASVAFGTAGSKWWTVGAGAAYDLKNATDLNVFGAYSYFVDTDIEFSGELGGWYYGDGDDAFGINPSMIFRWHFFNNQKWTLYGDIGIGVLFTTDDVPDGGSSINFTPRAGFGFTRLLNDSGLRWQTGIRWAHISNARVTSDEDNPSRDSAMLYTGLIWPF